MSIDLSAFSVAELEQIVRDAGARVELLKRQQYAQLRRSLEAQAREAGFDVFELFGGEKARAASDLGRRAIEPKYRNPANPAQTWGGIGKRPEWLRSALAAGQSLESLKIH